MRLQYYGPAVIALALAVSACGNDSSTGSANGEPDASETETTERLQLGILSDEGNLTPFTYETGSPGLNLTMLTYDTLMQLDADGVPQPWLADEIQLGDDGTSYSVDLHQDVTWHDGESLTAQDVAFSIEYYQDAPPGRFQTALNGVDDVEVLSDYSLEITLEDVDPSFEFRVLADVPILAEHVWSSVSDPDTVAFSEETNVGSGPYRLIESQPGNTYRLEANPDYFRGAPNVDEIQIVRFADDAGATAAIRANEIDALASTISPEQVDSMEAGGLTVLQSPEYSTTLLAFDTEKHPFDQTDVRNAIDLGIDVDRLVTDVYLDAAEAGNSGWVHPEAPWFNPDVSTEYDPAQAGDLLESSSYDGTDLELLVYGHDPLRLRLAELVAENLRDIGMNITVAAAEMQSVDDAVWPGYDVNQGRNYDMAIWGWSATNQIDMGQMASLIHSDTSIGNNNITGFEDERMDDLADAMTSEMDEEERLSIAHSLQNEFAELTPFKTLLYPNGAYAYDAGLYDGWVNIVGQGPMHKLSFIPQDGQP